MLFGSYSFVLDYCLIKLIHLYAITIRHSLPQAQNDKNTTQYANNIYKLWVRSVTYGGVEIKVETGNYNLNLITLVKFTWKLLQL